MNAEGATIPKCVAVNCAEKFPMYIRVGPLRRFFFKVHSHQQLQLMSKIRSHSIRLILVHTKRCYNADKVLEQGTFLKDMGPSYCHQMKILL